MSRLEEALAGIDALNREDPNTDAGQPKELLYSMRMSERLACLVPDASDELRIAVRAQHVCRWRRARGDYPEGRAGYKKWRSQLAMMHAELAGQVMADVGYSPESIERTMRIIRKRGLESNPEAQALEDCACLVFLQHYFAAFSAKHEREKLIDIVRKTWRKMSERARTEALALELEPALHELVRAALS